MLNIFIGNIDKNKNKYCEYNDAWFDKYIEEVEVNDAIRKIIKAIDNVNYAGNKRVISKYEPDVAISMKELSTGCKTAVNIAMFRNMIFSVAECGDNALQVIFNFKQGSIYIPSFIIPRAFKNNIDININGKICKVADNEQLETVLNSYFNGR